MRPGGILWRVPAICVVVLLLNAGVALHPLWAQDEGVFNGESYAGLYDQGGLYDDDWYYDAYDTPAALPYGYGGYGWYSYYPYYAGGYNEAGGPNSWYYDYYDYRNYDSDW